VGCSQANKSKGKKMIKKIRKKFKKVNSQKGFTLLEILVVLTIMGFLIAMVAPRLAGIGNDAVDTICDTNQNRMTTYLSTYFQQTNGSLPNNLTNLITTDGTGAATTYRVPVVQDGENEGALSQEFNDRNHFVLHYLNAAEVTELADLGIDKVFNLNDYTGDTTSGLTKNGFMASKDISITIPVLMTGIGATDSATTTFVMASVGETEWGEPRWFGRIVLGMGSECDLITSGIISNAAHCPGGTQNEFATYNDYNLVVPRLAATADRITTVTGMTSPGALVAVAYDGSIDTSTAYDLTTNSEGYKTRTFDLTEGQEGWQYETQCPEGHMYPEENDFWAIDLNDGGTIG
jgi:prepilin-type N-terminal cleavage/methylation domain-containing protein